MLQPERPTKLNMNKLPLILELRKWSSELVSNFSQGHISEYITYGRRLDTCAIHPT